MVSIESKKIKSRIVAKGYGDSGASTTRKAFKGFIAQSGNVNEDIGEHLDLLMERNRILYMSAPIATSAIKTSRTNVIGSGLKPKSRINRDILKMTPEEADAWEKNTEFEFSLWADNKQACDATGVNNFYGLEQQAFTASYLSGDSIVLVKMAEYKKMMPYTLRLHIIEADRLSTPVKLKYVKEGVSECENGNMIYNGVEVDDSGNIVAYHIRQENKNGSFSDEWIRVPAYSESTGLPNVIQVMNTERPEQYRGVPFLSQIIEPLLQLRRYSDSEITSAVVQSMLSVFIYTDTNGEMPFNETDESNQVSSDPNDYELGPATINILKPNERMELAESKHPNSNFQAFVRSIICQIGAAIEIPADILLKEFNSSYSASRAALLEAWKSFKMHRTWFIDDFCDPIYEIWLSEAIARGRIHAPGFFDDPKIRKAYLGVKWIGPAPGQLDPVKEVTAHILATEHGFETNEQATVELNGGNWDDNIEQITQENKLLMESLTGQVQNLDLNEIIKTTLMEEKQNG